MRDFVTATQTAHDLALVAAQAAADKRAGDIVVIDVSERLPLTDCFVLATGSNERQVGAIVDSVTDVLSARGIKPLRREGERDGRWVLLDFGDIVVHVQHAEERVFYALDRLWGDCPTIPFVDAALPADAAGSVVGGGLDDSHGDMGDGDVDDGDGDGSVGDGNAGDRDAGRGGPGAETRGADRL